MRLGISVAVLSVLPGLAQAERPLLEGEWEFDIWYNFTGVPQPYPSYIKRQCITREAPIPDITLPGQQCLVYPQGQYGGTYTWMANCSNEWEMVNGMGRIHYWGERADGDVHVQSINPYTPPQPTVFRIRGHRIGDCAKEAVKP